MPSRPWWIVVVLVALVLGVAIGYHFAPFSPSLTASTPVAPLAVACAVPAPAACPQVCTMPCCAQKPTAEQPKQYVHFLIKDIEVKTADATFMLGKVSFMYKGDGIEADVARTALGADTSKLTKVVDLGDLASLLEKLLTAKTTVTPLAPEDAAVPGPVYTLPSSTYVPCPAPETLAAPRMVSTATVETCPAPCATAPAACTTIEVKECEEAEDKHPEELEVEPELLPAPAELPVEEEVDC